MTDSITITKEQLEKALKKNMEYEWKIMTQVGVGPTTTETKKCAIVSEQIDSVWKELQPKKQRLLGWHDAVSGALFLRAMCDIPVVNNIYIRVPHLDEPEV